MNVPEGWQDTTLGSVLNFQRGFDITRATQNYGEIPVVSSGGISSYHDQAMDAGPGVVIGRKGTLGKAFYLAGAYWPHDTTLWVQDFKGSVPRFVYYFMTQFDTSWLDAGSANPTLNRNHLHPLRVVWPPSDEQQAIAEVLGALDEKIAANAKLAATGDVLVRAIYDDMAEGADETIVVDRLVANSRETLNPEDLDHHVPYLGLEHVPRRLMWATDSGSSESVSSLKARFQDGDILFGKLRPYFHKVVSAAGDGICSTDILVLRPKAELSGFALATISSDSVVAQATASSEGTRMPRASWKDLAKLEVPWPGEAQAKALSQAIEDVRSAVEPALDENRTLATIRDTLLPQLMSGKLRVKDAETIVAAAV